MDTAYQNALYLAVFDDNIFHLFVFRMKHHFPVPFVKTFQCGFAVHHSDYNIAVLCRVLLSDNDKIAVLDTYVNHTVAVRMKNKQVPIAKDCSRKRNAFFYLLHRVNRLSVVEAAGVGYSMTISETTYRSLPRPALTAPPEVLLYTYLSVRENDIELFGFRDERELSSFRMLLSVSGVGPRAALSILSIMTPEKFALAVCAEDRKAISKAPGIGPKTAARIILELKDKLMKETHMDDSDLSAAITDHTAEAAGAPARGKLSEAQDALLVLGYTRAEAQSALRSIDIAALSLEDIIKEALKKLMKP